ncbi:type II secretion system protein [Patescibacteria group bacterium]
MKEIIKGFTLIELLIVISIIGILATIFLVSFTSSQRQARDVQRKSDLKQFQAALENYANANDGLYPGMGGPSVSASTLCSTLGITCPVDPLDGTSPYGYYFQSGTGTAVCTGNCATTYTLRAELENETIMWVVCSTGESGKIISGTGFADGFGNCPL